jgi:hypothetical protein
MLECRHESRPPAFEHALASSCRTVCAQVRPDIWLQSPEQVADELAKLEHTTKYASLPHSGFCTSHRSQTPAGPASLSTVRQSADADRLCGTGCLHVHRLCAMSRNTVLKRQRIIQEMSWLEAQPAEDGEGQSTCNRHPWPRTAHPLPCPSADSQQRRDAAYLVSARGSRDAIGIISAMRASRRVCCR